MRCDLPRTFEQQRQTQKLTSAESWVFSTRPLRDTAARLSTFQGRISCWSSPQKVDTYVWRRRMRRTAASLEAPRRGNGEVISWCEPKRANAACSNWRQASDALQAPSREDIEAADLGLFCISPTSRIVIFPHNAKVLSFSRNGRLGFLSLPVPGPAPPMSAGPGRREACQTSKRGARISCLHRSSAASGT